MLVCRLGGFIFRFLLFQFFEGHRGFQVLFCVPAWRVFCYFVFIFSLPGKMWVSLEMRDPKTFRIWHAMCDCACLTSLSPLPVFLYPFCLSPAAAAAPPPFSLLVTTGMMIKVKGLSKEREGDIVATTAQAREIDTVLPLTCWWRLDCTYGVCWPRRRRGGPR